MARLMEQIEASRLKEVATRQDLAETKADIIRWVAGMFIAQSALIIGAMFAITRILADGH
ncbi:MAG: hypothetical protein HQL66_13340 [Magnetococcales bacterium]|nr:hypothetical protein [Magnetococcales bacterium]